MMKNILCVFLVLFWFGQVQAQNNCGFSILEAQKSFDDGDFAKTLSVTQSIIDCKQTQADKNTQIRAYILLCQAYIRQEREGLFDSSIARFEKYVEEKKIKNDTVEVWKSNLKAESLLRSGFGKRALDQAKLSLKMAQSNVLFANLLNANTFNLVGLCYWNLGSLEEALYYLNSSLDLKKQIFATPNHPEIAGSYNNLGLIYANSEPRKSEEYYKKALNAYSDFYSPEHPSVAICLTNLAHVSSSLNNYNLALASMDDALEIQKKVFGSNHPIIAFSRATKASIYFKKQELAKAKQEYTLANTIYKEYYGKKHPEIANTYNQLSMIALSMKKTNDALLYCDSALEANSFAKPYTFENCMNPLMLLTTNMIKAQVYEVRYNEKTAAIKDLKSSLNIYLTCDTLIGRIRNSRSNIKDKIALGEISDDLYPNASLVSFTLFRLLYKKEYKELVFHFVEKNKAAVLQQSINQSNAFKFANLPDAILEEEKQLKAKLAEVELEMAEKMQSETEMQLVRKKLFEVTMANNDFEAKLEKNYLAYFELKYQTGNCSVANIQSKLSDETAAISYLQDTKNNKLTVVYVDKGHFKIAEIALEKEFNITLSAFRNLSHFSDSASFKEISYQLYQQLFPISIPSSIKKLIIIRDGKMNAIPFESLLYEQPNSKLASKKWPFLLRKYAISYLPSLHSLLNENAKSKSNISSIYLSAPIQFDATKKLNTLVGSEEEVRNIQTIFNQSDKKATLAVNKEASEFKMKEASLAQYDIIHWATHGVVNENTPELSEMYFWAGQNEDGDLFGNEIFTLKLNARLVTLSACETGLGKVVKGEGMIGLTRAFLYAGASNVLVSLWKVSDKNTSKLMQYFYTNLLKTNDLALSLQKAKLQLLDELSENEFRPNEYYWSPFILIGY